MCARLASRQARFTRHDADAMKRDVRTVLAALSQPVGTSRASAKGGGVTEAEYDGAVVRLLAASVVLVETGAVDSAVQEGGVTWA